MPFFFFRFMLWGVPDEWDEMHGFMLEKSDTINAWEWFMKWFAGLKNNAPAVGNGRQGSFTAMLYLSKGTRLFDGVLGWFADTCLKLGICWCTEELAWVAWNYGEDLPFGGSSYPSLLVLWRIFLEKKFGSNCTIIFLGDGLPQNFESWSNLPLDLSCS